MQPTALQLIMPPLVAKWAAIPDTDRELLPLFECLTSLAQALGVPLSSTSCACCMQIPPNYIRWDCQIHIPIGKAEQSLCTMRETQGNA